MSNNRIENSWKKIIVRTAACFLFIVSFIIASFAQQSGAGKNLRFLSGGGNTGSVVAIPDSASLDVTNAITLEAWVRRSSSAVGPNRIFTKAPEVYTLRVGQCCDQRIQFLLNGSGPIVSTVGEDISALAAQWVHLAATWDGNGDKLMRIYINGRESSYSGVQGSVNPPLDNSTTELWLGFWSEAFNGNIDQARLWNVARTPNQIRDWMHKTENLSSEPGLVSVWQMNEGTGLTTADLLGLNNGTLYSCDRFTSPCTNNSNAPQWQNSTALFGDKGVFVDASNLPTATGPTGGTITATITSAANLSNNLGLYQFGTLAGGFVSSGSFDSFPLGIASRSNIVWGAYERGTITANLVFDYSQHQNIGDPSKVKILKRTDANDTSWEVVSENSRNDTARTITLSGVTTFEEYALGIGGPDCAPAPAGLVSWWTLDETSGTTALDVRSRNNAADQGTPVKGAGGKVATAYTFNSSDDGISVPDNSSLDFGTNQDFTIAAWIKTSATGSSTLSIVDKRVISGSVNGYTVYLSNGNLAIQLADGGASNYVSASGDLRDGQWHHVAISVDRDNPFGGLKFYLDGTQVGPATVAMNGDISNNAPFLIGKHATTATAFFSGSLDEVEVFDRALSAAEIAAIASAGASGKCRPTATTAPSNAVGWWTGDGDAKDFSATANHGTLQNGTAFAVGRVGQSFDFDGTNDVVQVAHNNNQNIATGLSGEAWIFPRSGNAPGHIARIFDKDQDGANNRWTFSVYHTTQIQNTLNLTINGGININTFLQVQLDQWNHVAFTYDFNSGLAQVYINGFWVASQTAFVQTVVSNPLYIGNDALNTRPFKGLIDEATIYSRALTQEEITSIYNAGVAGKLKQATTNPAVIGDTTVTFSTLVAPGTTQVVPLDSATQKAIPSGMTHTGLIYDIATTAMYSGNVEVCFNLKALANLSETEFSERRVLHLEGTSWVNRTSSRNFSTKQICAVAPSLSPFAIVDSNLAPTAATVRVSGRVYLPRNAGERTAQVSVTNSNGERQTISTDWSGYYSFDELSVGETYIFEVFAKRYRFAPRVINLAEQIDDLNFIPEP